MDLGATTHPGCVRPGNEDGFFASRDFAVFAVADGMGGHAHGEVASHLALDVIAERAEALAHADSSELPVILHETIQAANVAIFAEAQEQEAQERMGTTLVLATIRGDRLYFAHIGDSRLYLARGDALSQLTRDHSLVQSLVDRGEITPEEAAIHPLRHQITRVVGGDNYVSPEIASQALEAGDSMLLCTDGLSGAITPEQMKALLVNTTTAQEKADALVHAALDAGAPDNVTALVVTYERPRPATPPPDIPEKRPRHILPFWQSLLITLLVLAIVTVGYAIWAYMHPAYFIATNPKGELGVYKGWPLLPMLQHEHVPTPDIPTLTIDFAQPILAAYPGDITKAITGGRDAAQYLLKDITTQVAAAMLARVKTAIETGDVQFARSQLAQARTMGADAVLVAQLELQIKHAALHPKPKPITQPHRH